MIGGVNYEQIDARGLHVSYGEQRTDHELIEADTIVLCTGQEPQRALLAPLQAAGRSVHLIGGAELAAELDAKRAIDQATARRAAVTGGRCDGLEGTPRGGDPPARRCVARRLPPRFAGAGLKRAATPAASPRNVAALP